MLGSVRPLLAGTPDRALSVLVPAAPNDVGGPSFMARPVSGFHLSRESLERFDDAIAEVYEVMREATLRVDRVAVARAETVIRSQAAQADPAFGRFMCRVTKKQRATRATQ